MWHFSLSFFTGTCTPSSTCFDGGGSTTDHGRYTAAPEVEVRLAVALEYRGSTGGPGIRNHGVGGSDAWVHGMQGMGMAPAADRFAGYGGGVQGISGATRRGSLGWCTKGISEEADGRDAGRLWRRAGKDASHRRGRMPAGFGRHRGRRWAGKQLPPVKNTGRGRRLPAGEGCMK